MIYIKWYIFKKYSYYDILDLTDKTQVFGLKKEKGKCVRS
jgi:hypothetical protein